MVDLEEHCFPPATTLSGGGAIWERVSPCLVILVFPSCFSSATVWVSYEVDLDGLAFLWLLEVQWGTWTAGPGTPDRTGLTIFCLLRSANALVWVWPCPPWGRTGNLQSLKPVLGPVLTSPCSPLWPPLWTPWVLWTDQRVGLWTGRTDPGCENTCTTWTDCELVYGSTRPWSLWRRPTPLAVGSPFWMTLCLGRCSRCLGPG